MDQLTPCLWFDTQAEEAANYYVGIFENSKISTVSRYGEAGPGTPGSVMVVDFELNGQPFTALNGGPEFTFSEAISFQVYCESQEEVDRYWDQLTADGGEESQCGWLKDKYGLSWQIVPKRLMELMNDPDEGRSGRAMQAMLTMQKIDIAAIEAAAEGK